MRLPGITVWDGADLLGPATLTWSGDRIGAVEPGGSERFAGLAVIPGLVDSHVHLVGSSLPGSSFSTWPLTTPREEQVLHGVAHALRAMRRGVTTLRDLAGDRAQVAIRRAFDAGVLAGPRVLVHGVVGMTAGHCDLFVPPALGERPPTADGPWECRRLVRAWARDGVDGIKVTTSGGVLSTGDRSAWRNYTRDEVRAVVDESHALQMRVAAHAHSEDGIAVAIEEGVDSIEHGTLMTSDQAKLVAERGVTVAPTLLINEAIAEARVPVSRESQEKAADLVARRDVLLRQAAESGVQFVLGTDANGYHVDFGDELTELRRMHEVLGLSPADCLRAGTSRAASAVGLGDRVGRLAAGYAADFVVIDGAPWENIGGLRPENVVAVVCRGELVAGTLPT
ncbi:MAG TPA: amidohydrolase family protein [Acidimicrobiales bacterium]|nr:amidohydrolase family protein [Acidimicrobiales bacterium]